MDTYKIYGYKEFLEELLNRHKKAEKEYKEIRDDFDPLQKVKELTTLFKMIKRGLGLNFFLDVISKQPAYRNKIIIKEIFSDYLVSGDALLELINYYK
ncbi:MAG: hypothetical protein RSE00_04385 [Clostridia bacterium]